MAYGCRTTCDNCRPKYVNCPSCHKRNFLVLEKCKACGAELTREAKEEAVARWQEEAKAREIKSCMSP